MLHASIGSKVHLATSHTNKLTIKQSPVANPLKHSTIVNYDKNVLSTSNLPVLGVKRPNYQRQIVYKIGHCLYYQSYLDDQLSSIS